MKKLLIIVSLVLFLFHGYIRAVNKVRVALFDVRAINTSQVYADKLYSELRNALSKSKKLAVVTGRKEDLIKKIEEWKKTGCTEVECMANAGSELGVDKVISAELRETPEGYYEVDVIVVDVLTQEIEFIIPSLKEEKVAKFNELSAKIVNAIESKIIIQPVIVAIGEGNSVFIDAGADLGIERGMKFKVERWLNVQLDERGKIIYVDKQEVGEIQIVDVQPSGAKGIIVKQNIPFERGDKAVFMETTAEKIDEPPAIYHSPIQASIHGRDIEVTANITDDNQDVKAFILYRNKGEASYKSIEMKKIEKDKFSGLIPAVEIRSNLVEYMIKAIDSKNQETVKSDIGNKPFLISILPDNIPPEISHTPIAKLNVNERAFIRCIVKDNVKVGKVIVSYKKPDDLYYTQMELHFQGGSAYAGELPASALLNTNQLYYYITAQDLAGNTATFGSETKPNIIKIEFADIKGPSIVHLPVKEYKPGVDINITAYIKDESGVKDVELFFRDEYSDKFTNVKMFKIDVDKFSASIPSQGITRNAKIYYFISAQDEYNNISTLPSPESPFVIVPSISTIPISKASDRTPPFVIYFPAYYYKPGLGYPITLMADDETGISKVILYYSSKGDSRYRSHYLRNFAPQGYGDYINVSPDEFAYYITVVDVNGNVSMVASPNDPIIVRSGKIVSGNWQYIIGSWPNVPKPGIQLISPFNAIVTQDSKKNEFNFTFNKSDLFLKLEGIVSSYRELKAVYINSEPANIIPATAYEVNISKLEGPIYKFIGEVPLPNKYNAVEIKAVDISGATASMKLNINRTIEPSYAFVKPNIQIIAPQSLSKSDSFKASSDINSIQILGIIDSEMPVKLITINEKHIPFIALTSEERTSYKVKRNSVKFLFEQTLTPGVNKVNIKATDIVDNTSSKVLTIFLPERLLITDVTPPEINIIPQQTGSDSAILKAMVVDDQKLDYVRVFIRDIEIPNPNLKRVNEKTVLYEDKIQLVKGVNKITITASDGLNTNSKTINILHIPKRNPPAVYVLSPTDTITENNNITLRFIVEDKMTKPSVMVVVNDQLSRGIGLKMKKENSFEYEQQVVLNKGENVIKIIAYNESVDTTVVIKVTYREKTLASVSTIDFYQNSWAVLIAVDNYKNLPKLKYAIKDAKGFKEVLIRNLGFQPNKIIELYDKDATKQNISKILGDELPKKVGKEDRVVVFFAVHGLTEPLPAGGEMGYLVPIEGDPGAKYTTCISMTEVNNFARLFPAKHMIFIVDACYGGLAGWLSPRSATLTEQTVEYVKKKVKERGRHLLTAGQKDEQVYESELWGHSVFTYYLIKALQGGADTNNDGVITITELFNYVEPRVSNDTGFKQTPMLRTLPSEGDGEIVFIIEK